MKTRLSSMAAIKSDKLVVGLVLDTSLDPNDGVQQYVIAIGAWLSQQGHEVHYLVGQTDKRQLQNLHSLARNISVRFNGNRTTIPLPTSQRKLRSFLKQYKFDVLHVQVPHSPFMAQKLILAASDETAVVGTFHILPYGWLARMGNKALGVWLRPSLKRFDKMLAVSSAAADFSKSSFGIEADILPNVVDYQLFHQAKPFDRYGEGVLNILFLGRLVPRKGCLQLLEAAAYISQKVKDFPTFRIIICGKGPLDARLRDFVQKNHLNEIVEFAGFITEADKPRYYASADISVFPSSGGESFGIVLLEAMASGKALVLAGDNPGYRSVMKDQPDLLFDPKNSKELAAKIVKYANNIKLRQDLSAWGSGYTANFDTDKIGRKLVNIYEQTLRNRRSL